MIIETQGLTKSFRTREGGELKTVEAVRGVDLGVREGEIFGFLGPNGAGKTTTLRMLATLIPPDAGTATIAGADLFGKPAEVRRRIGYVAQGGSTWDEVTAREELVLHARMYGIGKAEAERRAAAALDAFDLAAYADRRCKTYSGGQRRRVDIALGIIHSPKVVFLDEPTTGLDPQSRARMWDEIRRLRAEGITIFITTHYLDEADALCDRVAIIDYGEIVAEGTPAALKREISGEVVTVVLGTGRPVTGVGDDEALAAPDDAVAPGGKAAVDPVGAVAAGRSTGEAAPVSGESASAAPVHPGAAAAEPLLRSEPYVRRAEIVDEGLRLYVDTGATAVPRIMRALDARGFALESIEVHRPSLDDVFLAKTGRSLRES